MENVLRRLLVTSPLHEDNIKGTQPEHEHIAITYDNCSDGSDTETVVDIKEELLEQTQ
jgi:hypothetical protein